MSIRPDGTNDRTWCKEHGHYRATCVEAGLHEDTPATEAGREAVRLRGLFGGETEERAAAWVRTIEQQGSAAAWNKGRWAGALDALSIVRGLNGNGHDEPSDPALSAAEEAIQRMIEHRHGATK